MLINWKEPPPKYEDTKKQTFEKYERKVAAIIQNIDSNSLYQQDKDLLKIQLIEQVLSSMSEGKKYVLTKEAKASL